jgi:putative ABC transport system ATP-binding protein
VSAEPPPSRPRATAGEDPVIRMRGVCRDFPVGDQVVHALRDVDLDLARGEFLAVMGPSGSGKSTLLNLLGCLDTPTRGSYLLAGEEVARLGEARLAETRRNRIGFVFQTFHLVPRLTAQRNVELPMTFAGVPAPERKERAERALGAVGLLPRALHRPAQLSGGERQRVALARAVVMEPDILLADEPTGNLDLRSGEEVLRLLEQRNATGITLIVVTHNPDIGGRAHRLVRLVDGRVESDERRPPGRAR